MAIVRKHALKNALIPVITMIGGQVSMVIGGNVIIESIFNIPRPRLSHGDRHQQP